MFLPILERSNPHDYIIISGLSIMCSIASVIFALKHRRVNYLIYSSQLEMYEGRELVFDKGEDYSEVVRLVAQEGCLGGN